MLKHKYRISLDVLSRIASILIIFGSNFYIAGCFSNFEETQIPSDFQDRSWLQGKPCSPPCWYGLVPDQATESDVLAVLKELNFIDSDTIVSQSSQFYDYYTDEYFPAKRIEVQLKIKNGERGHIRFLVTEESLRLIEETLNYEISLGKVVEILGIPDYVLPIEQPQISGDSYCSIRIFWSEKQLSVEFQDRDQETWLETCESILIGMPLEAKQKIHSFSITNKNMIKYLYINKNTVSWPGLVNEE